MPGDADREKKSSYFNLRNMAAMATMGLLGFLGKFIWGEVQKSDDDRREIHSQISEISNRIKSLEDDKSKWGVLAEMSSKIERIEIELEVTQRIFEYEFGRAIPRPRITPKAEPKGEPPAPPELHPIDPNEFRNKAQQRYPNEPKKK